METEWRKANQRLINQNERRTDKTTELWAVGKYGPKTVNRVFGALAEVILCFDVRKSSEASNSSEPAANSKQQRYLSLLSVNVDGVRRVNGKFREENAKPFAAL